MVWKGNGMVAAWERHAMCESAFKVTQNRNRNLHEVSLQQVVRQPVK